MKKIILFFMILILLSGCSSLTNFTTPNDIGFLECIAGLDTVQKIAQYMVDNFEYETHRFGIVDPYTLWKTNLGDCNDMASFGMFVANFHEIETWQIIIYEGGIVWHSIAVYKEWIGYSYTSNYTYFAYFAYGNKTFRDIVESFYNLYNINWVQYKVYDYNNNLMEVKYNGKFSK